MNLGYHLIIIQELLGKFIMIQLVKFSSNYMKNRSFPLKKQSNYMTLKRKHFLQIGLLWVLVPFVKMKKLTEINANPVSYTHLRAHET